ncbi:MAG: hypothetical protein M1814_005379 [Vezdaea aestivalis]|nr:MAG: hypothetical protein M1814_005379 [Vezdaea aestivalis]
MKLFPLVFAFMPLAFGSLLIDYHGGDEVSSLGSCQLEAQNLGDHIGCPGNNNVFIKPSRDPTGCKALHFHRDQNFRRAQVRASLGPGDGFFGPNKKYSVGYEFMLSNAVGGPGGGLTLFQWKRKDKKVAPVDNIPFYLTFTSKTELSLLYTVPGNPLRQTLATIPLSMHKAHKIALEFDTTIAPDAVVSGNNALRFWLDGRLVLNKSGLSLWSSKTPTYPKFGIYRGECDDHCAGDEVAEHTFDSWVYRVQIAEGDIAEVGEVVGDVEAA